MPRIWSNFRHPQGRVRYRRVGRTSTFLAGCMAGRRTAARLRGETGVVPGLHNARHAAGRIRALAGEGTRRSSLVGRKTHTASRLHHQSRT